MKNVIALMAALGLVGSLATAAMACPGDEKCDGSKCHSKSSHKHGGKKVKENANAKAEEKGEVKDAPANSEPAPAK